MSLVEGFRTRDGTTDADAVYALHDDEYRLAGRHLAGTAIDIGAHIGTISIFLARTYPDLRVVAVEAVPDNAEILRTNVAHFGLGERVTVIEAWAGGPGDISGQCHYGYRKGEAETDGYISAHRFVGNTWGASRAPAHSIDVPAVSLASLIERLGDVTLLKIDCEGCEWRFLDTPAVASVETIVGEYHGGITGIEDPQARIVELLGATHEVEIRTPEEVVGLFEAVRR